MSSEGNSRPFSAFLPNDQNSPQQNPQGNSVTSSNYYPNSPQPNRRGFGNDILLIAIFGLGFVLAFVLALHLYFRWTIRRHSAATRRSPLIFLSTTTREPETARPSHGLHPTALAAIPSFPYTTSPDVGSVECAVCLSDVEDGEVVRELPGCGHIFHVGCIDMWLHSHSTCPVCRAEAEPKRQVSLTHDVEAPPAAATEQDCGQASGTSRLGSLRRMLSSSTSRRGGH